MKLEEIMALVNAGYTKEEIAALEQPANPEPAPAPAPEPAPAPQPEPAPAPTPAPEPAQPTMADLMQSIAKLTSAVQANAIANSIIPGGNNQQPAAEDMLAEIIRPTFKEREK